MKLILVKLVLFCTIFLSLNAEEVFFSVYDTNNTTLETNLTNESNSSSDITQKEVKAKSVFLKYENIPSRVYVNEVFSIKVKAVIATQNFEELQTSFDVEDGVQILNQNSNWKWFSDNIFYNTYYVKISKKEAKLPTIRLGIFENDKEVDSALLKPSDINIVELNGNKYFSGVIANSLKIKKHKTTQFDDKNNIIVLELEAKNSNLKDFHLDWVIRDGIDSSETNLPFEKIYYYAIIPNYTKKFDFTYFDKSQNKFIKNSIPIAVLDDSVSTQIDLNPEDSSLKVYKDTIYALIALSLLILLIKRKKIVYFILLILLAILFIYDKNPFNSIKIEKRTKLKILPTKKSTIFYITNRTLYVQKLDTRDTYIKVLLPNGKIGWINKEDK